MKRFLYRNYRLSWSVGYRLRRRVTRAGWLVIAGLFLAAGVGVDTNQAVAYQAFAVLLSLVGLGLAWSAWPAPRLVVRRDLPPYGTVGEPLPYQWRIHNPSRKIQRGLSLIEDFEDPRPSFSEFITTPEPGEGQRNVIDRWFGYYRWAWLLARKEKAAARERELGALGPGKEIEVKAELLPNRRGTVRFKGATILAAEAFGLLKSTRRLSVPGSVLILPRRYPVARLPLSGKKEYQLGGVALASAVGDSEEFIGLREYRPGDSLRHIHWKSWAKVGRPVVKEFQDEFLVRHALVLDTFHRDQSEALFEDAVSAAASFAATVDTQESLLDLLFVGPSAYCFTAGRSLAHVEQMLELLAAVEMCRNKSFQVLSDVVLEHAGCVSSCLCILLRWDQARQDFIKQLAARVPTTALVMMEPGEKPAPNPLPGTARLEWIETGTLKETLRRL